MLGQKETRLRRVTIDEGFRTPEAIRPAPLANASAIF